MPEASTETAEARNDLAPNGVLRAGINTMNMLLVTGKTPNGDPEGVAPDMAAAIAAALGVELSLVPLPSPAAVADGATEDIWDIGLIAAEPKRAEVMDFTNPYVEIEATYLVPEKSEITSISDVDQPGIKIAVAGRSAYDLYLDRTIQHADLVRGDGLDGTLAMYRAGGFDVLAGLRPALLKNQNTLSDSRILDGKFMAVEQAIGTRKDRPAGLAFVKAFVTEAKANGLVASLIDRHGVTGQLSVAG